MIANHGINILAIFFVNNTIENIMSESEKCLILLYINLI